MISAIRFAWALPVSRPQVGSSMRPSSFATSRSKAGSPFLNAPTTPACSMSCMKALVRRRTCASPMARRDSAAFLKAPLFSTPSITDMALSKKRVAMARALRPWRAMWLIRACRFSIARASRASSPSSCPARMAAASGAKPARS